MKSYLKLVIRKGEISLIFLDRKKWLWIRNISEIF